MTTYRVFVFTEEEAWHQVHSLTARSPKAAISTYLTEHEPEEVGDTYVAVPARSWRPVSVKVETKTALKFS